MSIILDWIKSMDANWVSAIAAVVAGLVAIVAAIFAWWSARSAEKQNELALHQRKVDAFKEFSVCFNSGIYLLASEKEARDKNYLHLQGSVSLLKFLFRPSIYNSADKLLARFTDLIVMQDKANVLGLALHDSYSESNENLLRERKTSLFELSKETVGLRNKIINDFFAIENAISIELTLYKDEK